jgi:WS/DGAT/MGAT family acyltransferase
VTDDHLSDMEAMMLNVERDPWLDPNGGSIAIYDRELDIGWFRRSMKHAVAENPRLRQRVEPGLGALTTPRWVHDPEFDLDWHLRLMGAPGDGSLRDLLDHFSRWLQDGYDHTRPLWQYVVVDGLEGGRGALLTKVHHSVADGESLVKMSLNYTSDTRDVPPPNDIDLDRVIDGAPKDRVSPLSTARDAIDQGIKRQANVARRLVRGVANPLSIRRAGSEAVDLAKTATEQLHPAGSDLWRNRSGQRHVEAFSLPFESVRAAAHARSGTINDLFLTGAVEAATRYHQQFDSAPEKFHITLVVNTHTAGDDSANAFSPVPVEVEAGAKSLDDRFAEIHALVRTKRGEVHGAGPLAVLAPVLNVLPIRLMTEMARDQASHIDFATSNLPGYRHDTYVAGAKTLHIYPFGPVAGTAFNLTMISTGDVLDVGINIDPVAVVHPNDLAMHLQAAYADLLAIG